MHTSNHLPAEVFGEVIRNTPLVAIDLVVRDQSGRALLGKRLNRPAQGYWFAPGGRIRKNETLDAAFLRLTAAELGQPIPRSRARLQGVWDHIYEDNVLGAPGYGTHYVVLAHELWVDATALQLPTEQHDAYRWLSDTEILADATVHPNTQAYFRHTGV